MKKYSNEFSMKIGGHHRSVPNPLLLFIIILMAITKAFKMADHGNSYLISEICNRIREYQTWNQNLGSSRLKANFTKYVGKKAR